MKAVSARTAVVGAAVLAQFALVPLAVAEPLSARLTGTDYLLEVAPVDPIDPFRGAYVALSYPGLTREEDLATRENAGDVAYVPLVRKGEVWVGRPAVSDPPESGPFLRCKDDHWQLRCGIESWFLPQDKAYAVEQAVLRGRTVATVRVDSRGNAALIRVDVR